MNILRKDYVMENNNEELEELTVTMTLEDGTCLECDVIAKFPVEDKDYIALLPQTPVAGYSEDEVFLYRLTELDGDNIELTPIDDDDEYEAAADAFDELLDEAEFNELES